MVLYGDGNNGKTAYGRMIRAAVEAMEAEDKFCQAGDIYLVDGEFPVSNFIYRGADGNQNAGKTVMVNDVYHGVRINYSPTTERLIVQSNLRLNPEPGTLVKMYHIDFNSHFVSESEAEKVDTDNHIYPGNVNHDCALQSPHVKNYLRQLAKVYAAKFLALDDFGSLF